MNHKQPLGHALKHDIAYAVTEGVVDQLETIEVEEEHGDEASGALQATKRMAEPVHQDRAVGHAGERVRRRAALEQDVRLLTLGDVTHGGHDERRAVGLQRT